MNKQIQLIAELLYHGDTQSAEAAILDCAREYRNIGATPQSVRQAAEKRKVMIFGDDDLNERVA